MHFANELAKIAQKIGVNVWEAIHLANYHPRVNVHSPGPGVGGHCIAVDPWFLVELDPGLAQMIHLARQTNDGMPAYTAQMATDILAAKGIKEPKIAVLGLAFKGNIDDMRESPAVDVVHELRNRNLKITAYDPHIKTNNLQEQTQSEEEAFKDASALLVLTNHEEFNELDPIEIKKTMTNHIIIDTKNCINRSKWENAGFDVYALGDSKN